MKINKLKGDNMVEKTDNDAGFIQFLIALAILIILGWLTYALYKKYEVAHAENQKVLTCEGVNMIMEGNIYPVTKNIIVRNWSVEGDEVHDFDTGIWFMTENCHPIERSQR